MDTNEGCGCDEKDEGIPEEVTLSKKGILRDFQKKRILTELKRNSTTLKAQRIICWKLIQT